MSRGKKALVTIGIILAAIIVLALFGALGLWGKKTPVDYELHNEEAAGAKIALITDNTEYKMAVKDALVEKAGSELRIEVFGLEDTKVVSASEYDLTVVMAPVYAGRLQTNAKNFIKKNADSANLMLIITAEGTNDIDMQVDTVTMATSSEFTDKPENQQLEADEAAEQILAKLN